MEILFYIAALLAIISTFMVITRKNAVHALLYLIVSFLAISVVFFLLGAPFIAALEVIVYAGAIMVLFVFVMMMLNRGDSREGIFGDISAFKKWIGPVVIALILTGEMIYLFFHQGFQDMIRQEIPPAELGKVMFTQYALIVDLAGFILAAGIIGAYHLAEKEKRSHHRYLKTKTENL